MTRVLVTGARGLLGGALVQRLARDGMRVLATGRQSVAGVEAGYAYRPCELADAGAVGTLFDGRIDAVIHAAGRIRSDGAGVAAFVRDNVLATANLVDAAQRAQVRVFVHFSTISVYSGNGPFLETSPADSGDVYGWSKRAAEELCLFNLGDAAIVLRLGGLHGTPRQTGVVRAFFDRALRGCPIEVEEPATQLTPTFIDDVAAAVQLLLQAPPPPSRIYNLATAEAPSYRELAQRVCKIVNSTSSIVSPAAPGKRNRVLDTARIRAEIGFDPMPLDVHLMRFARAIGTARA